MTSRFSVRFFDFSAYNVHKRFYKENQMEIYTVRPGDTIFSISRQYGVPESRIVNDNLLSDPTRLTVGESLIIRFPSQTYTVRGGDTLSFISESTGTDIITLLQYNPILKGRSNVYPGQVLNTGYPDKKLGETVTNGYVYPFVSEDDIRSTLPYLTYLSVFSYGFRPDGSLIDPDGGDERLLALSREYGTIPMLTLTSISENGSFSTEKVELLLSSPDFYKKVAGLLAKIAAEKGYGGVDLDFEYIPTDLAESYADFAKIVKEALPDGYELFVSLAPKTSASQPGLLYEGHRYDLLGKIADRVLLMTYEWGYKYGPPLAVSPLPQVERVIQYGVSEIKPAKILMGVPNYGYDWELPYIRGETVAKTISNTEALQIATDRRVSISFDETAEAPFFNYYAPRASGGIAEHVIWFDDARSIGAKLPLIARYSLGGGGVWNVTRYFPALWTIISTLFSIRKKEFQPEPLE